MVENIEDPKINAFKKTLSLAAISIGSRAAIATGEDKINIAIACSLLSVAGVVDEANGRRLLSIAKNIAKLE